MPAAAKPGVYVVRSTPKPSPCIPSQPINSAQHKCLRRHQIQPHPNQQKYLLTLRQSRFLPLGREVARLEVPGRVLRNTDKPMLLSLYRGKRRPGALTLASYVVIQWNLRYQLHL